MGSAPPTTRRTRTATCRVRVRPRAIVLAAFATVAVWAMSADVALAAPAKSVSDVLNNIRSWLAGILALLATVFVMVGGVRYILAGGDPSEVEKGKTALRAAAIGYMLAALASLVVSVLKQFVGL